MPPLTGVGFGGSGSTCGAPAAPRLPARIASSALRAVPDVRAYRAGDPAVVARIRASFAAPSRADGATAW
jgi:hypothetical protein